MKRENYTNNIIEMEKLSEEELIARKRAYMRKYMTEYRQTHEINRKECDKRQRMKPEYRTRELLRMKNIRLLKKEYNVFRRAIPYYLTE